MRTRSQTMMLNNKRAAKLAVKAELPVEIDFDEASTYWKSNKIRLANGTYKYKTTAFANIADISNVQTRNKKAAAATEPRYNTRSSSQTA